MIVDFKKSETQLKKQNMIPSRMKLQLLQLLVRNVMILFFPIAIISGLFFLFAESLTTESLQCLKETNLRGKKAFYFLLRNLDFNLKNLSISLCNIVLFSFLKFQKKYNWKDAFYKTSLLGVLQLIIYSCYSIAMSNKKQGIVLGEHDLLRIYFETDKIFYAWYIPLGWIAIYYFILYTKKGGQIIHNRYF